MSKKSGDQTQGDKPIDAEPVDAERAPASKADHEAEDAAVISETTPTDQNQNAAPLDDAAAMEASAGAADAAADPVDAVDDAEGAAEREDRQAGGPADAEARSASGGSGVGRAFWGAAGALIGGALVLLVGESMRPETLPVDQIATRQAVEARVGEEIRRLAGDLNARIDAAATDMAGVRERLALLDDRDQRGAETAKSTIAAQAAEIATLQDELATERSRVTRLYDGLAKSERERAATVTAIREQVSALAAAVTATPGGAIGGEIGDGGDGAPAAPSAASATRLALLEGGLRRLEARLNGLSADALPTPDLTRIDKLETAARAEAKAREALDARLDAVERSTRSAATGGAALGVAFAALSEAVASAEPYADALTLVGDLAPPGSQIGAPLAASAETGLPSYVSLAEWLKNDSWKALDAAAKARLRSGEASMIDRLSNVFTFRPHVEPGDRSDSDAALLDRARRRIEARDAAGALAEANKLSPAAKNALGDWRKEAARRAEAERALAVLKTQLLGGDAPEAEAGR